MLPTLSYELLHSIQAPPSTPIPSRASATVSIFCKKSWKPAFASEMPVDMARGKKVSSVGFHLAISPKTKLAFSLNVVSQALLYNDAPQRVCIESKGFLDVVLECESLKESYLVISNVYALSFFS